MPVNERKRAWIVAGLAGSMLGLGACSNSTERSGLGGTAITAVQPADFAGEVPEGQKFKPAKPMAQAETKPAPIQVLTIGEQPAAATAAPVTSTAVVAAPGTKVAQPERTEPSPRLVTTVGTPTTSPQAAATSPPATIEAVVGQINGRPVFATEILEPLDGRLKAAASDAKDAQRWRVSAAEAIVSELKRRIEEELILSEARTSLTPEQRQGLLSFMKTIESSLVSSAAGSEVKADEEYRQRTGRSLRKEAEDKRDQALIQNEINLKVRPRIVVSWRDVQNEYERQQTKFNPPAEYHYRMIYADAGKADVVQKIQQELDSGRPFVDVAGEAANEFNAREQGLVPVKKVDGSQSDTDFHPVKELNEAFRGASVGRIVGPVTYSPNKSRPNDKRIAWVYLERIDQPKGVSLYDAQLGIQDELRRERTNTEIERYFERLRKRGNVSRIEVMAEKLMQIATDRYAPRFSNPQAGKTG